MLNAVRMRPTVKTITKEDNLFLKTGDTIYKIPNLDKNLIKCLEVWRHGGTIDEFKMKLENAQTGLFAKYLDHFDELVKLGYFEDLEAQSNLSPTEKETWTRSIDYFSEFETDEINRFQYFEKLRNSKVVVVGAGGMGSWVIYQLLCLGIGNLFIIDGDEVELSNLNRAILYTPNDVGRPKVECAKEMAKKFTPTTKVDGYIGYLQGPDDLSKFLDDVDLVVCCADKPTWLIQQWVADACIKQNVPFISGSGGRVGPLCLPGETACRMCLWASYVDKDPMLNKTMEIQRQLPSARPGVVVSNVAMMASYIANETFLYLTGIKKPNTLNKVWLAGENLTSQLKTVEKNPNCVCCGKL